MHKKKPSRLSYRGRFKCFIVITLLYFNICVTHWIIDVTSYYKKRHPVRCFVYEMGKFGILIRNDLAKFGFFWFFWLF